MTVTDNNGITTTASANITEPSALLSVNISSITHVAAFGASTGSLTVSGTGGTAPYEYKLGNGSYQSAASFTGLAAGVYTITVKDRNNVTANVTATVTGPSSALSITVTSQTSVAVFCAATGSVTVEGSGGSAPYEYKLGNGSYQSGRTFAGLAGGVYTINVKDAAGSISAITVTISQPLKALSLTVTSKRNATVYNGANGEVVLSADGGTRPYQYKLDNGTYRESPSFDGLHAKAYIATVKDASGVLETINFVIEQPEQLAVSLDTKTAITGNGLSGSTIKLKAVGGVSSYLYKIGDGEYQSSDTFENVRPGKYVAFVKDSYNTVQTLSLTVSGAGIPNVFTPNGDGKNDVFFIAGLENYDRVELTVFNRWGSEVYRAASYDNKWEGAGLNSGTYYYVIKLIKDSKEDIRKGWVLLKK